MKVLIISHNPMSVKFGIGKTLLASFSCFKKEELCQLYTHAGVPDRKACESYYRITDRNVLKGVLTRKVKSGTAEPVPITEQAEEKNNNIFYKNIYKNQKNKLPSHEFFRDIMWKISPWYNKQVKEWIVEQKPTCIYVAIGSNKFLYDIAIKISRDYELPIYTYVCDDFYFANTPNGFWGYMWKKALDKKTCELMSASKQIISICDEMSELYSKEFFRPALTVMTGTNYQISKPVFKEKIRSIRYFGRLNLNRYKSIAEVCRALDKINSENGTDYTVEIFCKEPDENIKSEFRNVQSAKFSGFLLGKEFEEKLFGADVLLHVEAFDSASIDRVKHSVSTKIADSLASGIPLLAYGPSCVASIAHLIRNNCGIVATDSAELKEKLYKLFFDGDYRKTSSIRNIEVAKKYHNPQIVSKKLHSLLSDKKTEALNENSTGKLCL